MLLKLVPFSVELGTAFWGNKIEDFATAAAMELLVSVLFHRGTTAFGTMYFNSRRLYSFHFSVDCFSIKDYDINTTH